MGLHHSKPAFRALLLGLDSAGKTTLLKGLTNQEISEGPTTTHNVGSLKLQKGEALLFDLGGQQKLITFWRQYYSGTGIILFVIDSSDTQRVSNAKEELYRLIYENELIGIPLLVIANKQDMPGALSPDDIATELELDYLAPREVHIVGACAKTKQGFAEITAWVQAHAVTVANLPHHLTTYNQQLTQLQQQRHKEHIDRVNANTASRRASLASTMDGNEDVSKLSNPLASSNRDHTTTPNGSGSINPSHHLQLNLTDDPNSTNQHHPNQAPISPHSKSSHHHHNKAGGTLFSTNSTNDLQSPHTDPSSTSVQSSQVTATPRRPRLTVSIEQQVLQSQLHQQLLAQVGTAHNSLAQMNSDEVNKDGIPISQRHIDEFNPGKDDVVLEAPIISKNNKRASVISPLPSSRPNVSPVVEDPTDTSVTPVTAHELPKSPTSPDLAQTLETNHESDLPAGPLPQSQSLNNVVANSPLPTLALPNLPPTDVDQRDSFSRRMSGANRRQSLTQPSPSTSTRRRRSSVGVGGAFPLQQSNEDIENIPRARKLSLTQNQLENEAEDEYQTMTEPLVGHEELLQEPNLDTVKENEAVDKFEED